MLGYTVRRVLWIVPVMVGIATITFILMHFVPGGPWDKEKPLPPQVVENLNARYDLDESLWKQYWSFLSGAVRGDLRVSYTFQDREVTDIIRPGVSRLGHPGSPGLPLRRRHRHPAGDGLGVAEELSGGLPVRGPGHHIRHRPQVRAGPPAGDLLLGEVASTADRWLGVSIPCSDADHRPGGVTHGTDSQGHPGLGPGSAGGGLHPDGQGQRVAIGDHTLSPRVEERPGAGPHRNGSELAALISGSFIVETVFSIPGIGRLFVLGIFQRDYGLIMGVVLFYTFAIAVMNLVVDLLYGVVDPRIRYNRAVV